jgi:hypothetical protein
VGASNRNISPPIETVFIDEAAQSLSWLVDYDAKASA